MFCENCGSRVADNAQFCSNCGARIEPEPPEAQASPIHDTAAAAMPPAGAPLQPAVPPYYVAAAGPPRRRSPLWYVIPAVVVILAGLGVGLYFLLSREEAPRDTTSSGRTVTSVIPSQAEEEAPGCPVDFSSTRDPDDLRGVWAGELTYTEVSGDWETFGYPVSEGYRQPFMVKISEGSPDLDWRHATLRIDGRNAVVLAAGFEGRFLEIRGEWRSCDVSISVEYDTERGGFQGIGEYLHSEKHAVFDFFMALTDDSAWEGGAAVTTTQIQTSPGIGIETVNGQTITVDMPYDSGRGVYTGDMRDGVPHGQGRFEMIASDAGKDWSYEGQWQHGLITGQGVMTQDHFIFSGVFEGGLLNGACEITDEGVLRYAGTCRDGKLHGQGTLYTRTGMLLFEGMFENDMLMENAAARLARGEAFKPQCNDMDPAMYRASLEGDSQFGTAVAVSGSILGMGDQKAYSTIVIAHMGSPDYPVCLVYRYGVDEPIMTSDDWINAWGVVAGTFQFTDEDGLLVTCPKVEVIHWNNE